MTSTPRIRAFLPGRFNTITPKMPVPSRAGEAPQVFRQFGRALRRLERAASTRRPAREGEGA